MTALHWAATQGHAQVVKMLIEAGSQAIDAKSGAGSPLFLATKHAKSSETQELLLEAGATPLPEGKDEL